MPIWNKLSHTSVPRIKWVILLFSCPNLVLIHDKIISSHFKPIYTIVLNNYIQWSFVDIRLYQIVPWFSNSYRVTVVNTTITPSQHRDCMGNRHEDYQRLFFPLTRPAVPTQAPSIILKVSWNLFKLNLYDNSWTKLYIWWIRVPQDSFLYSSVQVKTLSNVKTFRMLYRQKILRVLQGWTGMRRDVWKNRLNWLSLSPLRANDAREFFNVHINFHLLAWHCTRKTKKRDGASYLICIVP